MKSKKGLIVIIVVLLIIIAALIFTNKQDKTVANNPAANNVDNTTAVESETVPEDIRDTATEADVFQEAVPETAVVPEIGDEVAEEIAVPKTVVAAAPGVESMFRSFNIVGKDGVFNPSTIIVNEGDTVHVDFTAEDKDYDIRFPSYGMKQTAKAGETKILEFQANQPGKFLYYCELCGGEESSATGNIIVVAKE